jgi:hypothetical protein
MTTTTAPTFQQIKAQVAVIRKQVSNGVIGIRAAGRWTGERLRRVGTESYLIEQCDSPLAIRMALRADAEADTIKVIITPLEERELSDDILVRLAKRKLFPVDAWQIVKALFQAHDVDPRLAKNRWIAEQLLEHGSDSIGYPSASGGFLDAELVWSILLERNLGLGADRPDLLSVLRWSLDPRSGERLRAAPLPFREGATAWLSEVAGPTVEPILSFVERSPRADAVAVGLAAGVVFHPDASGKLERAAGKMEERYFGGKTPNATAVDRWTAAASEVLRTQITDPRAKQVQIERSDEILRELGAESFAYLSPTSSIGFDQRLAEFGRKLTQILENRAYADLEDLVQARIRIREHDLGTRDRRRVDRLEMAIRLVRWLGSSNPAVSASTGPQSLGEAAEYQVNEGGFADWARLSLRAGDLVRELTDAYTLLLARVSEIREAQARRFAEHLRLATEAGGSDERVIPVEEILGRIVAPLAAKQPVLLLVMDGMSMAVCHEILGDIRGQQWIPISDRQAGTAIRPGLAVIPSVTEVSRTSLLRGELSRGSSTDELAGFAENSALRARSVPGNPPVLFHKSTLQDERNLVLSDRVRDQIASTKCRVVGVVINAVDDHLLKGEQIETRWTRDTIPVLPMLLYEARLAGRIVILVSDHGHVLDAKTQAVSAEGGERWRMADGPMAEQEILLQGPRVVMPETKRLIAPWSERIRYGLKKNGYHGGANPQEMVIPIVVLCPSDAIPEGWTETGPDHPVWWDEPVTAQSELLVVPPIAVSSPRKGKPGRQTPLLDLIEEPAAPKSVPRPNEVVPPWIRNLLESPTFKGLKSLAGRSAPDDSVFESLLTTLDQRGGKATSAALARGMNYPPLRLRGLLAVAQRILNVDGYPILSRDDGSDTVELNRELLFRQFGLE